MKSVGELLRLARERKKLTLAQISAHTAISENDLQAIEDNAFDQLSSDVATRGFLSLFASQVDMDPKTVIALYRRDVPTPSQRIPSLESHFFVIGQKRLYRYALSASIAGVAISVCIFMVLFLSRLRQAPPLKISTPQNEARAISPLFVRGTTASDAVVEIDGTAIGVNQDGEFSKDIDLDPGIHVLTIKAIGRNGKERLSQIVVTIAPNEKE